MTAYIHRFIDMTKDIVRTFEVITMAVYNIFPDPLIRPSSYDHIGSDEVFKIARCGPWPPWALPPLDPAL